MNTINKFFIKIILALMVTSSFAAPMKDDNSLTVTIPDMNPGFEFNVSALYLQPIASNFGWSVTTTVLPIPSPNWSVNVIEPDFSPGFNIGARYFFLNPGTDVQLNWSHLNTSDADEVIVNPSSQWVSPFSQTGTPPTQTGQITGISLLKVGKVRLKFNYDSVHLDMGKFINLGSSLQTRLFTGLSALFLKEEINSTFNGLPNLPIFNFNNTSTYNGIGPRLGLNNTYRLYHKVHLVGQLAGSILYGKMQPAQYKFTGTSIELILAGINVNYEGLSNPGVNQIVPALDSKLGLSYTYLIKQTSQLTVELGYQGAVYFDALSSYETNTNVIAIDSGSLSTSSAKHTHSNFSVGGPYITINIRS
ncbi:TPA: Lpg1974 family pore-forming outer membrane protein [Legionella anisa]